uniref:WAP domain-containing protein n=1 Tax=Laticauda laticaudata TaxID=8630 RepID=A0A8C5SK14_LATLA
PTTSRLGSILWDGARAPPCTYTLHSCFAFPVKPGECPKVKIDPDYPCNQDCACDSECEGNKKCCPVGCARECFSPEKAGICPQAELERPNGNCTEECQSDAHCEGNQKCCQTGCGTSCWIPDVFLPDIS